MNKETLQPVIRQALGTDWHKLHPAVRRHYDISAEGVSELKLSGTMDEVDHAYVMTPFMWIARLFGALIPFRGKNLPVEVYNHAEAGKNTLFWKRHFHFPGRKPFYFFSRMEPLRDNLIVEYVRYRMGICMAMSEQNGTLCYESRGYLWNLGPLTIRLPDWLLLGNATIVEQGIDENTIQLAFNIHHPLFGRTFTYSGSFELTDEKGDFASAHSLD